MLAMTPATLLLATCQPPAGSPQQLPSQQLNWRMLGTSLTCSCFTLQFLVPVDAFADNGTNICLNAFGAVLSNGTALPTVQQCQLFKPWWVLVTCFLA